MNRVIGNRYFRRLKKVDMKSGWNKDFGPNLFLLIDRQDFQPTGS